MLWYAEEQMVEESQTIIQVNVAANITIVWLMFRGRSHDQCHPYGDLFQRW